MEKWKDYIHNYQVSNLGRLRNKITKTILKQTKAKNGYMCVVISLGSRENKKSIKVHRAVAELFLPNPYNLPEINHKNGDKTCNAYWNLEWCDRSYNIQHAYDTQLLNKNIHSVKIICVEKNIEFQSVNDAITYLIEKGFTSTSNRDNVRRGINKCMSQNRKTYCGLTFRKVA